MHNTLAAIFLSIFFILANSTSNAEELRRLYEKNLSSSCNSYEVFLVEHTKESLEKALKYESRLNKQAFHFSPIVMHHLLNNLCSLIGGTYLHYGLNTGEAFVSALYGNTSFLLGKFGISLVNEDFKKSEFDNQNRKYITNVDYKILDTEYHLKNLIDIYFCDTLTFSISPKSAFFHFNHSFAPVFIAIIDDWGWEWIRKSVFETFDELNYSILYEQEIPPHQELGNGQYLVVIKKQTPQETP